MVFIFALVASALSMLAALPVSEQAKSFAEIIQVDSTITAEAASRLEEFFDFKCSLSRTAFDSDLSECSAVFFEGNFVVEIDSLFRVNFQGETLIDRVNTYELLPAIIGRCEKRIDPLWRVAPKARSLKFLGIQNCGFYV